ncbi:uncharacterized protein O3Q21_015373 isoform 3-T5 [Podargus strigoides]
MSRSKQQLFFRCGIVGEVTSVSRRWYSSLNVAARSSGAETGKRLRCHARRQKGAGIRRRVVRDGAVLAIFGTRQASRYEKR